MITGNILKILGLAASILSFGASILGDYVSGKQLDEKISNKIAEELAKKNN